jgi:replicative DNA helicase
MNDGLNNARQNAEPTAGDGVLTGADVLQALNADISAGKRPVRYPVGLGELDRIEIGPGRVLLLGGAPCVGKSAFLMQAIVDALRFTPALRALVCNVEMSPTTLMERQLARLSGIGLTEIVRRNLETVSSGRMFNAVDTLNEVAGRLAFVQPPFSLANVRDTASAFGNVGLIALDYIQRIQPLAPHADKRVSVDATMDYMRTIANNGVAVMAVSAVARSKDTRGCSSYASLSLASFRESSELEYGADDAYMLVSDQGDEYGTSVILKHLKARHSERVDIALTFDGLCQSFSDSPKAPAPGTGGVE